MGVVCCPSKMGWGSLSGHDMSEELLSLPQTIVGSAAIPSL